MDAESRHPSPVRLLAPIALIAFGVAFLLIVSSGGGGGGSSSSGQNAAEKQDLGATSTTRHSTRTHTHTTKTTSSRSVYIVKTGDTLGAIAASTGVPIAQLQQLNPGLDQFSLVAGQRIKLR